MGQINSGVVQPTSDESDEGKEKSFSVSFFKKFSRPAMKMRMSKEEDLAQLREISKCVLVGPDGGGKSTLFNQLIYLSYKTKGKEAALVKLQKRMNLAHITQGYVLDLLATFVNKAKPNLKEFLPLIKRLQHLSQNGSLDISEEEQLRLNDLRSELMQQENLALMRQLDLKALEYFVHRISEIFSSKYIPTQSNILRTRVKTAGRFEVVVSTNFADEEQFKLVDVGGGRTERKKWRMIAQDAHIIVFCASALDLHKDATRTLRIFRDYLQRVHQRGAKLILLLSHTDALSEEVGEDEYQETLFKFGSEFEKISVEEQVTISLLRNLSFLSLEEVTAVVQDMETVLSNAAKGNNFLLS
eukprot:snap_masked-scaffold_1-processed-gene-3.20-mRNA-1 protein AED:1.00 eAED:1.00 QI:0/-1/0/0/-1/1/1/0/356